MNALPIIVGVLAAVGVWLIVTGIRGSRTGDAATLARQRLARQEIGLGQSAVALDLEKPLGERLLIPMRRWFTLQVIRLTPATQAATFQRHLDFVGAPLGLDAAGLQILRIAGAATFGTIGIALGVFIGSPVALGIALLAGALFGFYLPVLWLNQLVRQRRAELESALPNALDAERTGVPIARTIAAHSAQMRVKRRLRIRSEAAQASLKILLPTVGCVFPTLWLILPGPALLVVLAIKH